MGNNAAFTQFEHTVITLYDAGVLEPDLLAMLGERYSGTDIDHGGKLGLLSRDGFDVDEILIKTMTPDVFEGLQTMERVAYFRCRGAQ